MGKNMRDQVKEHYGEIAGKLQKGSASCCCGAGASCCTSIVNPEAFYSEDLSDLPVEAVNASLGCANPLVFAGLKEGETVLDLGSGGASMCWRLQVRRPKGQSVRTGHDR